MNQAALEKVVASKLEVSQKEAGKIVDAVFDSIVEALESGEDKVDITSTVRFYVDDVEAKTARNPKTGESISVPAKRVIKVKKLKRLREAKV